MRHNFKWGFEACLAEYIKYGSKMEWRRNSRVSYNAAWSHCWLEEIYAAAQP